jgi:hypothetical protein
MAYPDLHDHMAIVDGRCLWPIIGGFSRIFDGLFCVCWQIGSCRRPGHELEQPTSFRSYYELNNN